MVPLMVWLQPLALAWSPDLMPDQLGVDGEAKMWAGPPVLRGDWEDDSTTYGSGGGSNGSAEALARCLGKIFSAEVCESMLSERGGGGYQVGRAGACEVLAATVLGGGVTRGDVVTAEIGAMLSSSNDSTLQALAGMLLLWEVGSCISDAVETAPSYTPRSRSSSGSDTRRSSPSRPAVAGSGGAGRLKVCNGAFNQMDVAVATWDGHQWNSEGWWSLSPRQCEVVSYLDPRNGAARYYASTGDLVWGGDHQHCVSRDRFRYSGTNATSGCARSEGFRTIGADTTQYTLRLTSSHGDPVGQNWVSVQKRLNQLGHRDARGRTLVEDGVLGPNTYAAWSSAGLGSLPPDPGVALQRLNASVRPPPSATYAGGGYDDADWSSSRSRGGRVLGFSLSAASIVTGGAFAGVGGWQKLRIQQAIDDGRPASDPAVVEAQSIANRNLIIGGSAIGGGLVVAIGTGALLNVGAGPTGAWLRVGGHW